MGSDAQRAIYVRHATTLIQSTLRPSDQVIQLVGADIFPPRYYVPNVFFFRAPADDSADRSRKSYGQETGASNDSGQSPWMGEEHLISSLRQFLGGPLGSLAGRMGEDHSNVIRPHSHYSHYPAGLVRLTRS